MQIGSDQRQWVSIDSPGVPTGGIYGHPADVEKLVEPLGYKLAWSWFAGAFVLYTERNDGEISISWWFKRFHNEEPLPVTRDYVILLQHMKEIAAGTNLMEYLHNLHAKQKYQQKLEIEKQNEAMREEVMGPVARSLGLRGSKVTVVVPSGMN